MSLPLTDLYYKDLIALQTPLDFGVAEMDWGAASFLQNKLLDFHRFGYGNDESETYFQAVNNWFLLQHNQNLVNKDVIYIGSLKYGIKTIFNLQPGVKRILNFAPYYNGYKDIFSPEVEIVNYDLEQLLAESNSSNSSNNNKEDKNNKDNNSADLTLSLDQLEAFILSNNISFILISNPHNPTGKYLNQELLTDLVNLCIKHQLYLIVDEAHADIITDSSVTDFTSSAFYSYDKCFCLRSIGKTFNVSGIGGGYLVVTKGEVSQQLRQIIRYDGQSSPNIFAYWLTINAYTTTGKDYISELNQFFAKNKTLLAQGLEQCCGGYLSYEINPCTYLAWVDYSKLNVDQITLEQALIQNQVKVNFASEYGSNQKFFRVNIATNEKKLYTLIYILNKIVSELTGKVFPCNYKL